MNPILIMKNQPAGQCITCKAEFSGSWTGECPECEQKALQRFVEASEFEQLAQGTWEKIVDLSYATEEAIGDATGDKRFIRLILDFGQVVRELARKDFMTAYHEATNAALAKLPAGAATADNCKCDMTPHELNCPAAQPKPTEDIAAKQTLIKAERRFNESTIVELEQQLAAEREAVRVASKVMESDRLAIADRDVEVQQLLEQLAAEREITTHVNNILDGSNELNAMLQQQLSAERKKSDWLWSVIKQIEGGTDLVSQLAATERKYLDMERKHRESERKLVAAQARCGELVKMCNDHDFYPDIKIDTTALDAAIAEAVKESADDAQGLWKENIELRAAQQPLVDAGRLLSNCAYNLAQNKTLTPRDRQVLDDCCKQWDAEVAQWKKKQQQGEQNEPVHDIPQPE